MSGDMELLLPKGFDGRVLISGQQVWPPVQADPVECNRTPAGEMQAEVSRVTDARLAELIEADAEEWLATDEVEIALRELQSLRAQAVPAKLLRDTSLLYTLNEGVNHTEINVTMANGSRDPADREALAMKLQHLIADAMTNGPDVGDGHDWEGFAGGCARFGCAPGCQPPEAGAQSDTVLMPRRLTAENGAKGLLIGEFHESVEVTCIECVGADEDDDPCPVCNGSGTQELRVPISWTTIKEIYAKAVEALAKPVPQASVNPGIGVVARYLRASLAETRPDGTVPCGAGAIERCATILEAKPAPVPAAWDSWLIRRCWEFVSGCVDRPEIMALLSGPEGVKQLAADLEAVGRQGPQPAASVSAKEILNEVVEILYDAGWRSTADAQWSGLKAAIPKLRCLLAAAPEAQQAASVPEEMPVPMHGMRLVTADEAYEVGYANGFNFCRKSIIGLRTKPGEQQHLPTCLMAGSPIDHKEAWRCNCADRQNTVSVPEWLPVVSGLIDHIDRNTCQHEETHRGGAIWEICNLCDAKWADDQGGKPEYQEPEILTRARELIKKVGAA